MFLQWFFTKITCYCRPLRNRFQAKDVVSLIDSSNRINTLQNWYFKQNYYIRNDLWLIYWLDLFISFSHSLRNITHTIKHCRIGAYIIVCITCAMEYQLVLILMSIYAPKWQCLNTISEIAKQNATSNMTKSICKKKNHSSDEPFIYSVLSKTYPICIILIIVSLNITTVIHG